MLAHGRIPFLLAALTLALAPAIASLLFVLAQFGQRPPETLPLPVAVFLGLLLATPVAFMLRRLGRLASAAAVTLGLAAAAAVAATLSSIGHDLAAMTVATAVALAGAATLLALVGWRTAMYGAINVFVVCTVLANFTLDSFLPLGAFFLVNVGTLFFGITFTQRDRVHAFGRTVVYRMIAFAAVANVVAALSVGTPLRYVAVSFLAIVVSEIANTEVYHSLLHRRWFARVASSNAVAAPIDTIIFTTLAFAGEPFATLRWMVQVIVTDVLVKYGASLVAAVTVLSRPEWVPGPPSRRAGPPLEPPTAPRGPRTVGTRR